jgi:hypothetical protein
LNITIDELDTLKDCNFKLDYYENNDGVLLERIISFSKGAPPEIISKIEQHHLLSDNSDDYYFYLPLEDEPFEEDYDGEALENEHNLSSIHKENHTAPEFDF